MLENVFKKFTGWYLHLIFGLMEMSFQRQKQCFKIPALRMLCWLFISSGTSLTWNLKIIHVMQPLKRGGVINKGVIHLHFCLILANVLSCIPDFWHIQLFIDRGRTASFIKLILMFVSDKAENFFQIILHHVSFEIFFLHCVSTLFV